MRDRREAERSDVRAGRRASKKSGTLWVTAVAAGWLLTSTGSF